MKNVTREDFYDAVLAQGLKPMDSYVGDTTYHFTNDQGELKAVESRDAANPYERTYTLMS